MKQYKLFLLILSISIALFGQKDNYSSFTDGNYIVDGLGVSKLEYERYKDNLDDGVFSQNYDLFGSVRSLYRNDVFDIHIDFDDVDEAGCSWGVSVAPADRYLSVYGITFQDGANVIDECGNFGVSGHSSPKFLSHYETATPGDVNILFDEPVIRVQINAGKSVTITMTAYDENDNILDESSLQGTSELAPISVETDGIRKVVISGNGIYVLDDLMVQTQNLRGTFQGDYYSAHTDETLIPLGNAFPYSQSGTYTVIDGENGTLETPIEFPFPAINGDGEFLDFIIESDWHTKRPRDMEIFYTAPNGEETVVASWTHPDKYDSEGGCSEDLDDFLENGSHLDCTVETPSYSIGFFNSEISLEQSDSLTLRILSAWSEGGIILSEAWVISGDLCYETVSNSYLSFDGIDDYVEIPDHELLSSNGDDFSVLVKFNSTNISTDMGIVTKFHSVNNKDWGMIINGSELSLEFEHSGNNWRIDTSTILESNQDYAIGFSFNYQTKLIRVYINGVEIVSETLPVNDLSDTDVPLSIGKFGGPYNDRYFQGVIDDLTIWNSVVTSNEIQSHMNGSLTGQENGLVGLWKLNEGSGDMVYDMSGNGNDGTINGATWEELVQEEDCPGYGPSPEFGNFVFSRDDDMIAFDFDSDPVSGLSDDNFQIRWSGLIQADESGQYEFRTESDDGVRLYVADSLIIDAWIDQGGDSWSGSIYLNEGLHSLVLEYYENGGGANCYLYWTPPGEGESLVTPAGYDFSIDDFVESVFFDNQFVSPSWSVSSVINADDVDEIYNTEGTINTRAVIGGMDLDQDGSRELIMTDYDGHRVIVFEYNMESHDFDEVWASPIIDYTNHYYNPRTVGTGDLDGDGKQEIVFPSSHGDNEGWHIYEWDGVIGSDNYGTSPSSVNSLEVDICCGDDGADFRGDHERTTIEDIDGDGKQELVIMIRRGSPRGTLITSVEGDIVHNGGGEEIWVEEFFVNSEDYGGGSPYHSLPADLNGDGDYELVNHTWNWLNFYNITSTGPDQYEIADIGSEGSHYQATADNNDQVSLFGGAAADIDGDGNDEAYFVSYGSWGTGQGDVYVVDYDTDDNVLNINGDHVRKIKSGDNFITENSMLLNSLAGGTISDVDGNGNLNILVGGGMITSLECNGDPGDSLSYSSENIYYHEYTEEITVTDSLGYISTSVWNNVAWASKVESNFNGRPLDFDNDGRQEILVSFQGISEFFYVHHEVWNESEGYWEYNTEAIPNENKAYVALLENETVQEINNIPVAYDQSYTVDEDSQVALSLSGSDVDEDELSYMVAQPPTHGEIIINEAVSNSSLSFDGVNDYVGTGVSLLNNMTQFTMAGWLNINTSGNREGFFGQNNAIEFGWMNSNTMWVWTASGGELTWELDDSFSFGQWHHIVAVGDGASMKIYIDGQLKATGGGNTTNYGSSSYSFNIGGGGIWDATGSWFDGNISDVAVWDIALHDSSINRLYYDEDNVWDVIDDAHLIGYWDFNEGNGDIAHDATMYQNDGTITGATWEVEEIESSFTYMPYNNFNGEDFFTYRAFDGMDFSSFATVTIAVTEINDMPHAFGDYHVGAEDDTLYAQLHGDDGDYFPTQQQMQSLTYSITSDVFHGDLVVDNGTGEFMYMPYSNFFGADSFYFAVTDNGTTNGVDDFLSDTAMVHIFVEPVNDAPVLSWFADTSMAEDSSLVLSIFASDVDNSDLSVSAYSSEEDVMVYADDTLLYIYAEEDWNGSAEIAVVANDNMSRATDVKQFMLTVTPVNDAPFFTMEDFNAAGDITSGVDTWVQAEDIDSDIFFFLEGAPSWLMMDGSRMIGQPDQDSVYVFTLSVSDSEHVVSEPFELTIVDHRPQVISLTDVPQDQGRQMKLHWEPGHMDEAGYFTQFSIWREVQTDTADLWDFITTVPWLGGEEDYSRIVPTLGDSTVDTTYYSTFRVTAHTEDVDFYHDSEPVTGYSIDNLHPSVPQGLMAVQNGANVILQWLSAEDADFNYHNVYRNDLDSVDPAMVFTTSDSFYVDLEMAAGSWEYWITSVDSAGNESDASEPVSVVLASEQEAAIPTVYALEQNYPNPFNPSTQIRYALPEDAMVTISIYDMMGRKVRTLVSQSMSPGYHTTLWNATNDKGLAVSAGMYIYMIQAGTYHHMKKMVLLK